MRGSRRDCWRYEGEAGGTVGVMRGQEVLLGF